MSTMLELFPTPVLTSNIQCNDEVRAGMFNYIKDLIAHCGGLSSSIIGFRDPPDRIKHTSIHKLPEFQWLNDQIGHACREYLDLIGVGSHCSLYAQKSWATVKTMDHFVFSEHEHAGSTLSVIYYLDAHKTDAPVAFVNSNSLLSKLELHQQLDSEYNHKYESIDAETGKLIIFPSNLRHFVPGVRTTERRNRISISYDIMVTNEEQYSQRHHVDTRSLNPSYWRAI